MQLKTKQASALIVTTLVLGLILSIALSMSMTSIMKRKASESSSESNLAYGRAETGIEIMMQKIKTSEEDDDLWDLGLACDGSGELFAADGIYKIQFKDNNDETIRDCDVKVSEVASVKSTGITNNNQRTVEVAVAQLEDVPSGAVVAFDLDDCPSGWIPADGDNDTPDLRGYFIRGLNDGSTGVDPNRDLGSVQDDAFEQHVHTQASYVAFDNTGGGGMAGADAAISGNNSTAGAASGYGSETRPKNVALLYCVKQ